MAVLFSDDDMTSASRSMRVLAGAANWGCYAPSLVPVLPQPPRGAQHPQHPRRYGPGAQMAIFGDFFASRVFSEPPAAGFRPASEICTKATPCVEVWQTSNLRRLRLGEEKKKKKKNNNNNKPQHENIYGLPIP